jgi:alkaline phosphatase D
MTGLIQLSRRRLLQTACAGALLAAPAVRTAFGQARSPANPFTLGVASGYPTADGVVLWTRLAPSPLAGGGMPHEPVPVEWQVASDERMGRIVQRGVALAVPDFAHSVHVEVGGLEPGRWYWYRFRAMGEASAVGRTRTAPALGAALDRFSFAFASCQQYEQGFYTAYRHMAEEDLDLVVHLGDYIYELSWGRDHVRKHGAPECHTLADYRNRYALYKSDTDLQAAHAAFPWICTWDDHEVDNDYANDRSEEADAPEAFLARRAAGYRAFYEHMPLPARMRPDGPAMRIYERVGFGSLVQFSVLDDRQYRSPQVCPREGRGGSNTVDSTCTARLDPALTLLGDEQERWLFDGLARSNARWNVIAQQTLMARLDRKAGAGELYWTDGWDGYPAARDRLLGFLAERRPSGPLVIGGDVHASWVADLKRDFADETSPTVATEFCGTSITSQSARQDVFDALLPENPHIRFVDSTYRGYTRMRLTSERCVADIRVVDTVAWRAAPVRTLASFAVENGKPGAQKA